MGIHMDARRYDYVAFLSEILKENMFSFWCDTIKKSKKEFV